jgi:feruloyl esterase
MPGKPIKGALAALLITLAAGCQPPAMDPSTSPSGASTADAPDPGAGALTQQCQQLATLTLPETQIHEALPVTDSGAAPAGWPEAMPVSPFCRVSAVSAPAVRFEVWLPLNGWNGRFQGVGNGGMAGTISYAAMAAGLTAGYAVASTDTGHQTSEVPFDASWAHGRPDLIEDFGHRALHLTTVHAKSIVRAFYGEAPSYAYYLGCSKGGQQGMMEAQRYPEDYDGLLVGNPANDWTRFYAGAHLWYSLATLKDPASYLPPDKLPALGAAVNAACDELDGIRDGVLLDPRNCSFDPGSLACPDGADADDCLTQAQVQTVRSIWAGSTNSAGEVIFPGLLPGGEATPGGWARWVTGPEPFRSLHWLAGEGFFRHFVFDDPDWDFRTFDYDRDLPMALDKVGRALDAADPNLAPLRDRGGKLLLYHGLADADISPLGSINYYDAVVRELGDGLPAPQALAQVQSFFRLFLVPGLGHCRGGPGVDQFDGLTALRAWVEEGVAPESITASRIEQDAIVRSLPLCPYPAMPHWDGNNDPMTASSFHCQSP